MGLHDDYLALVLWDTQHSRARRSPGLGVRETLAEDRLYAASLDEMIAAGIPADWAERQAARNARRREAEESDLKTQNILGR